MMRFRSLLMAATVMVLVTLTAMPAQAQIRQATVDVRGMSCPFCAFGVEKRLRTVDGVASVEVVMKEGQARLTGEEGRSIDLLAIPEAVRKAGFTAGRVEVVAEGAIRFEADGDGPDRYFLEASEGHPLLLLVNLSEEQRQHLDDLTGLGKRITVSGRIHFHADELPGLESTEIPPVEAGQVE